MMNFNVANQSRFPWGGRVVWAVGKVTFLEVIRDRLLYNILVFTVLLFSVGILASRLAVVISSERVILDFGLTALRLSGTAIGIFVGSTLVIREVERRTIHVALSHPITRLQFVFGKYLGLAGILILNWFLSGLAYFFLLMLFNGTQFVSSATLGWAVVFAALEGLFMGSLAVFFSSFTTVSLSIIFCIGLYLVGNSITQIQLVANQAGGSLQGNFLKILATTLPNLEHFNLGLKVTYNMSVPGAFLIYGALYGLVLILFFLMMAGLLLGFKEV